MDRDSRLGIIRRAYAKQIIAAAGVKDRRLENAFAAVPREAFLGRGPWPILRRGRGYVPTSNSDPTYLYDDILVGILPERNLNNGQPSFLASLIRQPLQVPAFAKPLADVLLDVEIAVVDRRELVAQGWQILDGFEIQFFP